jgi:hypothetical protein
MVDCWMMSNVVALAPHAYWVQSLPWLMINMTVAQLVINGTVDTELVAVEDVNLE